MIEGRLREFYAQVSASVQHTSLDDPEVPPAWWDLVYGQAGAGGASSPGFPASMGHATLGARLPALFIDANVSAHLAGERKASQANIRFANNRYVLEPFITLDAHVRTLEMKLLGDKVTSVSLRITNMFDTAHAEQGSLGIDIPQRQRTVFLQVAQDL